MIPYKEFKHYIPIQVRFSDVDRLNHVNNACYHTYFELGRVQYFNDLLHDGVNWRDKGFILARTEIDHLLPLHLGDEVYCYTRVGRIGNKSMTVHNALIKMVNGQAIEATAGNGIMVAMDYRDNTSITIPQLWRDRFAAFEK